MAEEGFKRKLSAILSADVAGYSRLMRDDEEATVRTLNTYKELIFILIERNQGRLVDTTGDNFLAEFASVVDAVRCAVQIQEDLKEKNEGSAENRKMEFRIGINLGDVILDGDRIYGDGVNVAARIESLTDPGGICISRSAYDQVKRKLNLKYEDIGEHQVKNIDEPVRVYKILIEPVSDEVLQEERSREPASGKRGSYLLSEKPSIAVLPFVNMSNDPEQEYFSDGMSEELIGALAKLEGLKVISRTSAFHFKGKDVDLRTVGEKLKVDNVLEGSVRKAGNQLRISAQLIKVADDTHIWSETYDRELKNVFKIQEEISQAVVENLKVALSEKSEKPLVRDYTKNTEAYELFLKARFYFNKGISGHQKAIEFFEKAFKADPNYAPAYAQMGETYSAMGAVHSLPASEIISKISALLQKVLEIDAKYAYVGMSIIKMVEYDWQEAERMVKRALELNPGYVDSHHGYSIYLSAMGCLDEAIKSEERALELDPLSSWYRYWLGWFQFCSGQIDQAIAISEETLELDPNNAWVSSVLARAYGEKGMYDKGIPMLQRFKDAHYFAAVLGYLHGKAGNQVEAQKILDDFLARSKKGYFSPYLIAKVYSGLGEKDKAFEWLDSAYEIRDPIQLWIKVDDAFHGLHSDPRWKEQMEKRGLAD